MRPSLLRGSPVQGSGERRRKLVLGFDKCPFTLGGDQVVLQDVDAVGGGAAGWKQRRVSKAPFPVFGGEPDAPRTGRACPLRLAGPVSPGRCLRGTWPLLPGPPRVQAGAHPELSLEPGSVRHRQHRGLWDGTCRPDVPFQGTEFLAYEN